MSEEKLLIWGIDGELAGNEGRLMACLPFFTREGTPGVFAARALDWSVDPERNLVHLANEEQALALGDKLAFYGPLEARPGFLVVVIGPMLMDSLEILPEAGNLFDDLALSCISTAEDFYFMSLDPAAYETLGLRMASLAKATFDREISVNQGAIVTRDAEAALSVLKGNPFPKLEELVVRRLIAARIKKDADAYRTTMELAALRLKETPKKVEELVENHYRILVEKSAFGVKPDPQLHERDLLPSDRDLAHTLRLARAIVSSVDDVLQSAEPRGLTSKAEHLGEGFPDALKDVESAVNSVRDIWTRISSETLEFNPS
jgi:hypothetical protein